MDYTRDLERLWCGDKQRSVQHFYGIGGDVYSFGYTTPDGVYHVGTVRYVDGYFVNEHIEAVVIGEQVLCAK